MIRDDGSDFVLLANGRVAGALRLAEAPEFAHLILCRERLRRSETGCETLWPCTHRGFRCAERPGHPFPDDSRRQSRNVRKLILDESRFCG